MNLVMAFDTDDHPEVGRTTSIICIASILLGKSEYLLIFPFIPIQITLIDQFVEGFPPFVLTFERNIKPVEKHFLKRSLQLALPSSLMIVFSVLFVRSKRASRTGLNSRTGEKIEIAAANVPKFTPGAAFKDAANKAQ